MTKLKLPCRIIPWALALSAASAVSAADSGFYTGLDLGRATYQEDFDFAFPLRQTTLSSSQLHNDSFAWSLNAGYRFNSFFAVEGGYGQFGKLTGSLSDASGAATAQGNFDFRVTDGTLALVGTLPFGNWEPFLKAGYLVAGVRTTSSGNIGADSFTRHYSERDSTVFAALGTRYKLDTHWLVSLELDQSGKVGNSHETGSATIGAAMLGITYRF